MRKLRLARTGVVLVLLIGLGWFVVTRLDRPPRPRESTRSIPGIGISHWQGAIDWPKVAGAGYRFVFMKATGGQSDVDPNYRANAAKARAAGLAVGAYHFAAPSSAAGDAVKQADHFLQVADLQRGDLVPMLDMESHGEGMDPNRLADWAITWLGRVQDRLDVTPLVYTGNYFWRTFMGQTTAVADAGYPFLSIASWDTPAPVVPAADWGGNGWTIWQWSNCGRVPGVEVCVNLNRLRLTRATLVRIP